MTGPTAKERVNAFVRSLEARRWLVDMRACRCCGERTDTTDSETGACIACFADGATLSPESCAACASGGRIWRPLAAGQAPPLGAVLRRRAGLVEYARPLVLFSLRKDES